MDERDYVTILQVAGMKGITTDELIKQALRDYITKEMQSFRTEPDTAESGQNTATEKKP